VQWLLEFCHLVLEAGVTHVAPRDFRDFDRAARVTVIHWPSLAIIGHLFVDVCGTCLPHKIAVAVGVRMCQVFSGIWMWCMCVRAPWQEVSREWRL